MEKRYETRSGDLFVRSWARVRCVFLDRCRPCYQPPFIRLGTTLPIVRKKVEEKRHEIKAGENDSNHSLSSRSTQQRGQLNFSKVMRAIFISLTFRPNITFHDVSKTLLAIPNCGTMVAIFKMKD